MKSDEQLAGPLAPPSKRQKIDMRSDSSELQPTPGTCSEAFSATGTPESPAYQNNPILISERSGPNKGGQTAGDYHPDVISDLNQGQQESLNVLNRKFRKLHRKDLIDFFLREAEAGSCKDLLSFIGDSALVETAIVPGAISDRFKDYRKPSDLLKHISHELIKFLSDLQLSGWSFCGKFDIPDILVTPLGQIRMRASRTRSLKPQSNRRNRKDFRCIVRLFLKVLKGVERFPVDFVHLLNLLKNFSEKERVLITRNPATMSEQERLSLLDRLFRSYEALPDNDDKLKTIIDGVPYSTGGESLDFIDRAKINIFLLGVLQYKNPLWLSVPAKKKAKKDKSLYPQTGRGVLKLSRNSMQHAFKGLATETLDPGNEIEDSDPNEDDDNDKKNKKKKKKRPPKKQRMKLRKPIRVQRFKPIQVDHILEKAFPGLLCEFAKLMNDVGLYEEVIQDLKLPDPEAIAIGNSLELQLDDMPKLVDL